MSSMFLEGDEIQNLTHRSRATAQARVLRLLGIEHKPRGDGTLVVLRSHVEQIFGGGDPGKRKKAEPEIDWSGVKNGPRTQHRKQGAA